MLGYFIEVSAAQAEKMPSGPESAYIHRQTMASAVRYTTVELSELEQKISSAAEKALALEVKLFEDLVSEVATRAEAIGLAARALAEIDVAAALAEVAVAGRWCRPRVDDSAKFQITGGRLPVVEAARAATQESGFLANDCYLAS